MVAPNHPQRSDRPARPQVEARPDDQRSTSGKQARANRRNARRSTGPRTAEGKRRSSLNAVTHGLFCGEPLALDEKPAVYEAFRNVMNLDLNPRDAVQLMLADRIVLIAWRLRRVGGAEAGMLGNNAVRLHTAELREAGYLDAAGADDDGDDDHAYAPNRRRAWPRLKVGSGSVSVFHGGDEDEDDDPPSGSDDDIDPIAFARRRIEAAERFRADGRSLSEVPASLALGFAFQHPTDHAALERLGRYEQRLTNQLHRALRDLRQLQLDRRARRTARRRAQEHGEDDFDPEDDSPCPFVTPPSAAAEADHPIVNCDPTESDHTPGAADAGATDAGATDADVPPACNPPGERGEGHARVEYPCHPQRPARIVQNEPISPASPASVVPAEGCDAAGTGERHPPHRDAPAGPTDA